LRVREDELVDKIGLDAVVFLRFVRMLRNIFLVLTVIGLIVLIPVNVAGGHQEYSQWPDVATLMKLTPQYIHGGSKFWAFTLCAYVFQGTVCGFVWWNYRAVLRLKRAYFAGEEYRASLHARTILVCAFPQCHSGGEKQK
jgi:calcium permeable stress-gated cation channel